MSQNPELLTLQPSRTKQSMAETDIGQLPSDWKIKTIGDLFEIQQGKSLSPSARTGHSLQPFLRTANVMWGEIDVASLDRMHFTDEEARMLALKKGDLLVCEGGDIGRAAMWNGQIDPCYYQNHLHRLRPKSDETIPEFYMYWLEAAFNSFGLYVGEANRTTIPNLSKGRLSSFLVPVPSNTEQKRIVQILSVLRKAHRANQDVLQSAKQVGMAVSAHLFTCGLKTWNSNKSRGPSELLGPLPHGWELRELSELVDVHDKKRVPLSEEERRTRKGKFAYCGANGIIDWIDDYLFDGEYILLAEDGGYWGQFEKSAYLMMGKFWVNNHAHVLSAKKGQVVSSFLVHILNFMNLQQYIAGTTRGKLTQNDMIRIEVPVPDLSEQNKIAKILDVIGLKTETETARLRAINDLYQTFLTFLLRGVKRLPSEDSS